MIVCPVCEGKDDNCEACAGLGRMTLDALEAWHNGGRPAQRHAAPERHAAECRALMQIVALHMHRYPCLRWFHRLENRHRDVLTARLLKAEGALPGVPDYFLPYPAGRHAGLYLEMKTGRDTLSPEQRTFLEAVSAAGFRAVAAHGAECAWVAIEQYCLTAEGAVLASPNVEVRK